MDLPTILAAVLSALLGGGGAIWLLKPRAAKLNAEGAKLRAEGATEVAEGAANVISSMQLVKDELLRMHAEDRKVIVRLEGEVRELTGRVACLEGLLGDERGHQAQLVAELLLAADGGETCQAFIREHQLI